MNWEQQFAALQTLQISSTSCTLNMRKVGDWYVYMPGVNRRELHVISGGCQSAKTPEDAVCQAFAWATDQKWPLEIDGRDGKRLVKWNGFMWADAEAPK